MSITLRCDLHIHTALSPCADNDMTPNNIVNMSVLSGLDAIAITDHNTCGNAAAVIEAAKEIASQSLGQLIVVPGVEVESSEEIHIVCLFPELATARTFGMWVESGLPGIKNKSAIFGDQLIMDAHDNTVGIYEPLLVTATRYGISEIAVKAKCMGGVAYPAHVDRDANGILAILGFIPPELNISNIEISRRVAPKTYLSARPELNKYRYIQASDAHRLWEIGDAPCVLPISGEAGAADIVKYLLTLGHPLNSEAL